MKELVEVDIASAAQSLKKAKIDTVKAMPKLIARLVLKGEAFMKQRSVIPHRTGTLGRGIHAYPTTYSTEIATTVTYTRIANIRSSKPQFIERTAQHIMSILPKETDIVIDNALRGIKQ